MRSQLLKAMDRHEMVDIMYLSRNGEVSKRRIGVLQVGEGSFRAYCYLRKSKRTFLIGNILALVPVVAKESMVI